MGYSTSYNLEITELKQESNNIIIKRLRESNESARYALNENGDTEESCKWYENEKDLIEFSRKFPNKVFILSGEGEESGDIWKKYFVNGKVQIEESKIQVSEFDENKLK